MPWSASKGRSLRQGTLLLLVPVMLAVSAIELFETRASSADAVNAAYDRSLLGAIKAIDASVSTASGGVSVELPYRVFELFELTASGRVNFRVATSDGLVEIGSPDLPQPTHSLAPEQPVFYDSSYFGESVRVGAYKRALDRSLAGGAGPWLVIQVAESTKSRDQFAARFLRNAATRDAVFLVLMILAVTVVVSLALRPVSAVARQVRARAPSDLAPIPADDLPTDLQPLVNAANEQMKRTEDILAQRRHFVDDASHQLRTPLTTLRTLVDLAARESRPEELRAMIAEISRQLDHATRGTNQLLALAKSDAAALAPTTFDLGELAREVAVSLLPRAREKGQDLGVEEAAVVVAVGDRGLLREALVNLADNAIRHSPAGSQVTICAFVEGGELGLAGGDDGPGGPAEEIASLGTRFFRGRGRGAETGSGLGLAIARSIAEKHGGTLAFDRPDGGTGFRATLRWRAAP